MLDDDNFIIKKHHRKPNSVYRKINKNISGSSYEKVHEVFLPDEWYVKSVATVRCMPNSHIMVKHTKDLNIIYSPSIPKSAYRLNPIVRTTSLPEQDQFKAILQHLGPAHIRNIGLLHSTRYLREIASAIVKGTLLGVGDSSVQQQKTWHSYILETIPPQYNICGVAPVDCAEEDTTSNRGESCTVLAMVSLLYVICELYNITTGSVTLYCDNKQGLRRRQVSNSTFTTLNYRDTDVKMEVEYFLNQMQIDISLVHVKGHADKEPGFVYARAPQQTQRNIDMDKNVQIFMQQPPSHLQPTNITTYCNCKYFLF